jgi:hypothetical protein
MISRSDGETYHLLLADRPLPYPLERSAGPTRNVTVFFWYMHVRQAMRTNSTVVIVPGTRINHPTLFRRIEMVADLLAEELCERERLAEVYELFEESEARRPTPEYARLGNYAAPGEAHWI